MGAPDFRVPPGPSWFQMREGASPPPPGSLPVSIPKALSWKAWKSPTSSPDPMNSGFLGLVPPSPGSHKGPSLALRLQEAAEGFCPPSRQRHPSRCPCPAWGVSSWVRAVCPLPLQPRAKPGVSLARGGRVEALALQTRRQAPRLRRDPTAQKERGAQLVGPKGTTLCIQAFISHLIHCNYNYKRKGHLQHSGPSSETIWSKAVPRWASLVALM